MRFTLRLLTALAGLLLPPAVAALAPGCGCAAKAAGPCPCGPACQCDPCRCPAAADPSPAAVLVRWGKYAGSGTVIAAEGGRSVVLTCRHVLSPGGGAEPVVGSAAAVECGGRVYPAAVLAYDRAADLAALLVEGELPAAELADAEPAPGEPVRQWGRDYRGRGRPVPKAGAWVGPSRFRDGAAAIAETTMHPVSGDSGAAVFDARGRVVAVCWGGGPGRQMCATLADAVRFARAACRDRFPRLAARLDRHPQALPPAPPAAAPAKAPAPKPLKVEIPAKVNWRTDYRAAYSEVMLTGKPAVILFTDTASCVECRKLEAGALADPAVVKAMAAFVCVRADVATPDGAKVAAMFKVGKWPTVLVYRGGKFAGRAAGNVSAEELLKLLK